MKKISPRLATTPSAGRMSLGKNVACRLGEIWPRSDGPSARPAITSPITRGCPTFTAMTPNRRATINTIAMARKTEATSLLKDSRCLTAVNFSSDGDRPLAVVSAGLAVGTFEAIGVATLSGITVTFCSWRSLAVAVIRAMPPLVHLTSPARPPVLLEYLTVPSGLLAADRATTDPVPSRVNLLPKQVEPGDSAYVPWTLVGVLGAAAPAGGGA